MDKNTMNALTLSTGEMVSVPNSEMEYLREKNDIPAYLKRIVGSDVLVVHIGVAGHVYYLKDRINEGRWFQEILEREFKDAIGIDINEKAVQICKELRPNGNYYYMDAISDAASLRQLVESRGYSMNNVVILMPDVLEHIDSPIEFMSSLKKSYSGAKLVLTTPNAYGFSFLKQVIFKNVEFINSDHKNIYSYWSLNKNIVEAGITPMRCFCYSMSRILRFLHKRQLADGIGVLSIL